MNDLKKLLFWMGVLLATWLYMKNIGFADLINAPVQGLGKAAETTLDEWSDKAKRNQYNPQP